MFQMIMVIIAFITIVNDVDAKSIEFFNQNNNEKFYESMMDVFDAIGFDNYNQNNDDDGDDDDNNDNNNNDSSSDQSDGSILELKAEEKCRMPVKKGLCRALIPRWNYDTELKDCKEFLFGGCDGNANNFRTYKQCIDICKGL